MDIKFFQEIPIDSLEFSNLLIDKEKLDLKPVIKSSTSFGKKINMGFLCYYIKIQVLTNNWNNLDIEFKNNLVNKLLTYQNYEKNNYFVDEEVYQYFNSPFSRYKARYILKKGYSSLKKQEMLPFSVNILKTINADNKQTLSTLKEINHKLDTLPQINFNNIEEYLNQFDWTKPWDAGAQFSSICVYNKALKLDLDNELFKFISSKLDTETGSYFSETPTSKREIINGAMKVLTGLDWLGKEIHEPTKLIDFCLANQPKFEGCDLVDYVYVLYKCTSQTNYRKIEVVNLLKELLNFFKLLHHPDKKGFSYFINKSQTHYYGIRISKGRNEPDIHGTLLAVWAIIMILELLEENIYEYKTIKP